MKLLTIIVTYNAMRWVDQCLGSVKASSVPSDIFIVDNGSTDGTRDYIAEHYQEAILICSDVNLMFGRANNLGMEYALKNGYDYVYLLNQDAWVETDTIERMIAIQKRSPEYGILSPMQMAADGKSYEAIFKHLIIDNVPDKYYGCDVFEVKFAQASHWLLSRGCIETVGGFSPSFPHYGEDDNYCQRAIYHGLRTGVVPAAKAVHDASNKPLATKSQKRYRHYINFLIYLGNPNNGKSLASQLWFLLRRAKGLAVERKSLTSFGGYFMAISHLPRIRRNRKLSMTERCAFLNYE